MKIEMIEGCLAYSLTVDGVEEIDMDDKTRQECIEKICEGLKKVIKPDRFNYFLQHVAYNYGKSERLTDEPCECCGDYIYRYTLEI